MKSIVIAGLLLGAAHGAHAAPYLNVEANQSYSGGSLGTLQTSTDPKVPAVPTPGTAGGPSVVAPQEDGSTELAPRLAASTLVLHPSMVKWQVPLPQMILLSD